MTAPEALLCRKLREIIPMDPAIYGPIISGSAGITGALIGAATAFYFNRRLDRRRTDEQNVRLSLMLALEVTGHAAILAGELDDLLPLWMLRGYPNMSSLLTSSNRSFSRLSHSVAETYRAELLHLPHAPQVLFHYDQVGEVNDCAKSSDSIPYAEACRRALLSSMGTMDRLMENHRTARLLESEECGNIAKTFRDRIPTYKVRLELMSLNYENLREIERHSLDYPNSPSQYGDEWKHVLRETRKISHHSGR